MKWKCKSCREEQESCWLGFLLNNNINCDKCIKYIEIIDSPKGKKEFINNRNKLIGEIKNV